MIRTLAIAGYRSLRSLVLPLARLTVVTGPNGSGKSNLYRSLRLLAECAQGRVIAALAAEGGLESTLWAGPEAGARGRSSPVQGTRRREPVGLKLGFGGDDYGYAVVLGLPLVSRTAFGRDPEIKAEAVWTGPVLKRSTQFAHRLGPGVHVLDAEGARRTVLTNLPPFDSMMTHAADPQAASELLAVREQMRAWRFYDHLRTDPDAPARRPQVGTRTPALAADGADLAAALQTIREIGDGEALDDAIADAFPGSAVDIAVTEGLFAVTWHQDGLLRPLKAGELSDGTLRFLLLTAALLTPRPPPLLVLNEPETSLHPDMLPPLARLIAAAAAHTQVLVVTHATALVDALAETEQADVLGLSKERGETVTVDPQPAWAWPKR